MQENNYYIIIMKGVLESEKNKSYGQLMIMKNFRPRSFSICSLDISDNVQTTTKQVIVARFGLNTRLTIDLVNLHLHSDRSRNASEKRSHALESLFKKMKTNNYMLIGDFNFGDSNLKEQHLLETYNNEIHDLWKEVYRLDEVRYSFLLEHR